MFPGSEMVGQLLGCASSVIQSKVRTRAGTQCGIARAKLDIEAFGRHSLSPLRRIVIIAPYLRHLTFQHPDSIGRCTAKQCGPDAYDPRILLVGMFIRHCVSLALSAAWLETVN